MHLFTRASGRPPRPLRRLALAAALALFLGAATLPWLGARTAGAVGDLTIRVYDDNGAGGGTPRNGLRDGAEPGVGGVTVTVFNADGVLQAANNTDAAGLAIFPVLPDGAYRVEVSNIGFGAPNGRVVSLPGPAAPAQDNALVLFETISGGPRSRDVGLRALNAAGVDPAAPAARRTVTSRVWDDRDADGVQDADEPGLGGLTLELFSGATPIAAATTAADGAYRFLDTVPAGAGYTLRLTSPLPAGYALTTRDAQGPAGDQRDSDAQLVAGAPQIAIPAGGQGVNLDSLDIGLAQGAAAGFVWRDLSADGVLDAGEPYLNGITVELVGAGDTVVATTTTRPLLNDPAGAAGFYEFESVPLGGSYRVRIPAAQFAPGAPLFGHASPANADDTGRVLPAATDSGLVPPGSFVETAPFTLDAADIRNDTRHLALYAGTLGDFVWHDVNRDGNPSGEEGRGLEGVLLFVDDGRGGGTPGNCVRDGSEPASSTDQDGFYSFTNLPLGGTYDVVLDAANFAPGGRLEGRGATTGARCGPDNLAVRITSPALTAGAPAFTGADFGIVRAEVGNFVWEDTNGDGVFDLGESAVPGVAVRLMARGPDGLPFTADDVQAGGQLTDASGLYTITDVLSGTYYAAFDLAALPAGYVASVNAPAGWPGVDPSSTLDLNDVRAPLSGRVWRTPTFDIAPGSLNPGVDAAIYRPADVSGRVFFDQNANSQDEATPEPGMHQVTVELRRADDDTLVQSATTDATGAYTFTAVVPLAYSLRVVNPDATNWDFVAPGMPAPGDPLASDVDAAGRAAIALLSGAPVAELDAGLAGRNTLSGRVFLDANVSNTQDAPDAHLAGAGVTLAVQVSTANLVTSYTLTVTPTVAADPNYAFAGLPGGTSGVTYTLDFAPPAAGYLAAAADAGADDALDSDGPGLTITSPGAGAALDADQGYFQPATIVARVFDELASLPPDNTYSPGDTGIPTATVTLTTTNGLVTPLAATPIDATGLITFTVPPTDTTYWLNVALPAGFTRSPGNSGARAVSPNPAGGQTAPASGAFDFGHYRAGQVTGTVRFDRDADDDLLADGEPGLEGVTVRLLRGATVVDTATTDAAGDYAFSGVPPGDYLVEVVNPDVANFAVAAPAAGDNDIATLSGADGRTTTLTVAPGATVSGQSDAAVRGRATVSGQVWLDADGDGLREGGESAMGLPDVPVSLTLTVNIPNRLSTTVSASAVTSGGTFSFANLPGGASASEASFDLSFATPSGWMATLADVGAQPGANDSDGAGTGVDQLDDQALGVGVSVARDRGYLQPVTIVARVFEERTLPLDNAYSPGDSGIPTATVTLTTTNGLVTPLNTPTIGADGRITFSVPPVDAATPYWLNVATPAGFSPSPGNAGARQVSPHPTSGQTVPASGAFDFGYNRPAAVSGRAFFDIDNDGVRDAGEPPVRSLAVELFALGADGVFGGGDDALAGSATTAADGSYSFAGLTPGAAYGVAFTNPLPNDLVYVFPNTGADDTIDSDVTDLANGRTDPFRPGSGAQMQNLDAGFTGTTTVQGRAFVDANGDGLSTGDSGLAGVQVRISHSFDLAPYVSGTIVATVPTDASGAYSITDLPGSGAGAGFTLTFTPPAATPAWVVTAADAGPQPGSTDSDGTGSGADQLSGQALAGGTNESRDQGYYRPVTIVARVFDERGAPVDNTFAAGDTGITTATVTLTTTNGLVTPLNTPTIGADGRITFSVPPSSAPYWLNVATPAGVSPAPGNAGARQVNPNPTSGQTAPASGAFDFGYYRPAAIAGTAWFDSDGDGARDAGEPGMEGVQVTLYRDADAIAGNGEAAVGAPATSDATGAFSFSGVEPSGVTPGSYRLRFGLPAGMAFTTPGAALATDNNSDADPAAGPGQGFTGLFTLGSGASVTYVDGGYTGANTLSGLVWDDLDGDGTTDAGEPPLGGATVTITLTTSGINSANPMITRSVATAGAGNPNYTFAGLPDGAYQVSVTGRPFGYLASTPATLSGSMVAAVTGRNFGLYKTAAVGDRVWFDVDGDGVYGAGTDVGVPGVTVELLDAATSAVMATTTSASSGDVGSYQFLGVAPGSYRVRFSAPAGLQFVNDGTGSTAADDDNDASQTGLTASFTVTSGTPTARIDAGLRGTASIGGIAWQDEDGNDVRDAIDSVRIAGVRATLTITAPALAAPLTLTRDTAADGSYRFQNLPAGSYSLSFAPPAGYHAVLANVGDDGLDSDGPLATGTLAAGQAVTAVDAGYRRVLTVFLPMVRGNPGRPDLVGSFTLTQNGAPYTGGPDVLVTVTVTNTGTGPTEAGFWVDLYINPYAVPSGPNLRWDRTCTLDQCRGIAWYVGRSLRPGESVTLTSTPGSYEESATIWNGRLPGGTRSIYIFVDSWNPPVPYGALDELNEGNNLAGRTDLQVGVAEAGSAPAEREVLSVVDLPERPRVP
ncbi:MAG TPA: SdrD B-like domain-containing protein [Roseiflexaceae bacterium]|nr:SdrD B-like domain-containing protein [Roseiflexaceae bacterium]